MLKQAEAESRSCSDFPGFPLTGEGKEMIPETPLSVKTCWTGTRIKSSDSCRVMSTHLITTQLTCALIIVNQLTRRGGAEWRCVDFELGWCCVRHVRA